MVRKHSLAPSGVLYLSATVEHRAQVPAVHAGLATCCQVLLTCKSSVAITDTDHDSTLPYYVQWQVSQASRSFPINRRLFHTHLCRVCQRLQRSSEHFCRCKALNDLIPTVCPSSQCQPVITIRGDAVLQAHLLRHPENILKQLEYCSNK